MSRARVHGDVFDAQGAAAAGAEVMLTDPLGAELQRTSADAAGRFAFEDVAPGRYLVHARGAASASAALAITLETALPMQLTLRLAPPLAESIIVEARADVPSTRTALAGESLREVPVRVRGRALQETVATMPGWGTEDNGLLHARGVDDGFLFVIDGVPVYERLDAMHGVAPDLSSVDAINVITGYVAPEFGHKAGGVIEVQSRPAADRWEATAEAGIGGDDTIDGGAAAGGGLGRGMSLRAGGAWQRSDRYLDPVHPHNLHNQGGSGSTFGQWQWAGAARDSLTAAWGYGRTRFDVPNTEDQDRAGQDQRQRVEQGYFTGSWQRLWSGSTVTQAAVYHRRGAAALAASAADTPLSAQADRSLVRTGALAAVAVQRRRHLLKFGGEAQGLSLEEEFGFFVTDRDAGLEAGLSGEALARDADHPFLFSGRARPSIWSFYVQDTWQAGAALTVAAGLRFDRSQLLLDRRQWSPRAGVAYRLGSATVLRGSISRFYQPPQSENLLLSSSEEARELSPLEEDQVEGGADVEPERQWAIEAGVERRFGRFRVDGAYWRRDAREAADPNVFFGTTIVFPNAVAKGRAHGVDLRLDVTRARGWSAYVSATVSRVVQTGPVTGGLFLEDEVADLGPGVEFVPDHDQRAALAAGATWVHDRSNLTIAVTGRYESGTPIQREDEDEDELAGRPGAGMVDFESGRVKPRTIVALLASLPLVDIARLRLDLRGSIGNVFDQRYAYNFGNPFSGTHFGAPRTARVALQALLR